MSDVLDDLCVCMHSRRYHDRNNERCHAGHCGCCKFVEFVEAQQAPEPTRSEPPRDYGDNRFVDWNLSQKVDVSPDVISSVAPTKPFDALAGSRPSAPAPNISPWKCFTCGFETSDQVKAISHMNVHTSSPAPSAEPPVGRVTCMNCGQKFSFGTDDFDKHECPVKLSELEQDAMAIMLGATFCDHYCCGMTKEVCRAKSLLQSIKDHGYELREVAASDLQDQARKFIEGKESLYRELEIKRMAEFAAHILGRKEP